MLKELIEVDPVLIKRLMELREEYFSGMTDAEVLDIYKTIECGDVYVGSGELIGWMEAAYHDEGDAFDEQLNRVL